MIRFVAMALTLVMVKVGNGKNLSAPVVLDRVGLENDLKKNERGQYQFAEKGNFLFEQTLFSEKSSEREVSFDTRKVCKIPVKISIPGDLPGLETALNAQLKMIPALNGLSESALEQMQQFTTSVYGYSKGKAHFLREGRVSDLMGRYTFRTAKQLDSLNTERVTGVVNDPGMGFVLPLGQDFNRLLVVDITLAESLDQSNDPFCEEIKGNGFVVNHQR